MSNLFSVAGVSQETLPSGSQFIRFDNAYFSAELSLEGGHLTRLQAHGAPPLLYISPNAIFKPGTAIRGGIPLCWPWFGPHKTDSQAPQHGIARISHWTLTHIEAISAGFEIVLSGPEYHGLNVELRYHLGSTVEAQLITENKGQSDYLLSQALHTYLAISDAETCTVSGLNGSSFCDKVNGQTGQHQTDTLCCRGEIDRIVYDIQQAELLDSTWQRRILVENGGSNSMIVWNPGVSKAQSLKDLPDEDWHSFFCLEAANAESDARRLSPGDRHTLSTRLSVIQL